MVTLGSSQYIFKHEKHVPKRMQRLYLSVYTLKVYTYRPVVYECHIHHGSKEAVSDLVRLVKLLDLLEEGFIEDLGFVAVC
jgi:hypothetical protein